MNDDPKTYIAVKLRGGRLTRDVWALLKILCLLLIPVLLVGVFQVIVCKNKNPDTPIMDCVAPMRTWK